jgi:hypothetical protein
LTVDALVAAEGKTGVRGNLTCRETGGRRPVIVPVQDTSRLACGEFQTKLTCTPVAPTETASSSDCWSRSSRSALERLSGDLQPDQAEALP